MADPKAPEPADEAADPGPYFCFCCDDGNVTRSDEDRCCLQCGIDLVPLSQMRALLSAHGLHICTEADKRVLAEIDVMFNRSPQWFRNHLPTLHEILDAREKARVAAVMKRTP